MFVPFMTKTAYAAMIAAGYTMNAERQDDKFTRKRTNL